MSSLAPGPARLYGALALAEMVTWTLLLLGMAGKYLLGLGQMGVRVGGGIHGFVFLSYCLVTMLVAVDQRWRVSQLLTGLGSAVVPYATVPFERHALRSGLLDGHWRLRTDVPSGVAERVAATAVRRPVASAIVGVVAVAAVFALLLMAGPPTQWFG